MAERVKGWQKLDEEVAASLHGHLVIAVRGDGKSYCGIATEITRGSVVLTSGNMQQILTHFNYRYQVQTVPMPEAWVPRLAPKRLL